MSVSSSSPNTKRAVESDPEPSRPTDPLLGGLPFASSARSDVEADSGDFDFHDTIPAPPWLDEALDGSEPTTD